MVDKNYDYAKDLNQDPFDEAGHFDPNAPEGWDGATPTALAEAATAESSYGGPSQNRSVQKGTIIIMLACLLGVGAIYFFSFRNRVEEVSKKDQDVEAQVDKVLARLMDKVEQAKSRKLFEDTQEMVDTFYAYSAKQQVALKELRRDPFILPSRQGPDEGEDLSVIRARQKGEWSKKLANVKLQSVIQGPRGGKCLVNGEVYSREDTLLGQFKIKEINDDSVILIANDFEFVLSM